MLDFIQYLSNCKEIKFFGYFLRFRKFNRKNFLGDFMNRIEIGERLRQTRENANISRKEASEAVKIGTTTLQQWENGSREASIEAINALASLYSTTAYYILFGRDEPNDTHFQEELNIDDDYTYIPYFSNIVASAGGGMFSDGVIGTDDFLAFRKAWIKRNGLNAKELVALNTDGDSMLPTIPENATILVDKSKNIAKDGRIYVIRIDDRLYVKRVQWIPTGGLKLISDNAVYESFDITRQELEVGNIQVYGQVIHLSYDLAH